MSPTVEGVIVALCACCLVCGKLIMFQFVQYKWQQYRLKRSRKIADSKKVVDSQKIIDSQKIVDSQNIADSNS
jgi:hypothetical protein